MPEEKAEYQLLEITDVIKEAMNRFGLDWLMRLLVLTEQVKDETGTGRIEVIIRDKRVHQMNKVTGYK